jgi:TonB family protein
MGNRIVVFVPLVASLAAHAAVIGGIAGASLIGRAPSAPDVIAVGRVEPGTVSAPRLVARGGEAGLDASAGGGEAIALDTADPRYRPYLLGVRERIWQRWEVPRGHAGGGGGTLVIDFLLTRAGTLAAAAVSAPSGVGAFDRAALAAVASAAPFAPLPASIAGARLRVRARFVYE